MGLVSPLGNTVDEYWSSLLNGKCGIGPITRFDVTDYPTRIAAEVKGFDPSSVIDKKEARPLDLAEQFAVCATEYALRDAGLDESGRANLDLDRCGVVIGSGIGGVGSSGVHVGSASVAGLPSFAASRIAVTGRQKLSWNLVSQLPT